ncbi:MAG: hypothetical protein Q9P44_16935 [Anaerolineae bacterium]|nr:hypothetical protein [Anaerolineae bacterium]
MVVRRFIVLLLLLLSGCGISNQQQTVIKIALLAPFEGRYREVGYDALYASRLAIADSGYQNIDLLAIDDGGHVESAIDRAHAIQNDPTIAMTLILGIHAADSDVQAAFGERPILIIGHWNTQPTGANVAILASRDVESRLSTPQPANITALSDLRTPIIGSELLALKQFPMLYDNLSAITVISSATLPDTDFAQRYIDSNGFAPQPSLLTSLTYDATRLAIDSIVRETPLHDIVYEGINGTISFDENGYWQDAPIYEYHYENGILVQQR